MRERRPMFPLIVAVLAAAVVVGCLPIGSTVVWSPGFGRTHVELWPGGPDLAFPNPETAITSLVALRVAAGAATGAALFACLGRLKLKRPN